jgi:membrane dipeptidase
MLGDTAIIVCMSTDPAARLRALMAHPAGIVDMHFDMLMDLYEKRARSGVLGSDYFEQMRAGNAGVVACAIFLEDKYLPEMALRVALDQIARLYEEVARDARFAICKSHADITAARAAGKIALLITMEGVEPLGTDPDLLRVFYELGVRSVGLTHARRNMAAEGGVFAPNASSRQGLSAFGRMIVQRCEALGILIDLAHLNPAGIDDVLAMTSGPLILSHTNPRKYYDVDRNSTDDQMRAVAARGGVIGINSVLVSQTRELATLEHYVDHIDYAVEIAGVDHVGIGFDFFHFIFAQWPPHEQAALQNSFAPLNFVPDLLHHGHAENLVRALIARGYADDDIVKILSGNWMRVLTRLSG